MLDGIVRTKEECKALVVEIHKDQSERHNALETLDLMLFDVQTLMFDLDQNIKGERSEFSVAFTHDMNREMFASHIRTLGRLIGVIRSSLVASAAEERGGSIPIKDFNPESMKVLKCALIKVVEETSY